MRPGLKVAGSDGSASTAAAMLNGAEYWAAITDCVPSMSLNSHTLVVAWTTTRSISSARMPFSATSSDVAWTIGCRSLHDGYGLMVISSIIQRSPSRSVSNWGCGSPVKIRQKPCRPARPSWAPSRPWAASDAAITPPSAARAAWMRLAIPPEDANSIVPDASDAAMPNAWLSRSASRPRRWAAAAAAPNTPDMEVGWKPASMCDTGPTASPARPIASYPTTTASRKAAPGASSSSATARAAGTTTAPGWLTASSCTSSSSKAWAAAPLAKAAMAGVALSPQPTTVQPPP